MCRACAHIAPFDCALAEFSKLPAFAKELRRAGAQGAISSLEGSPNNLCRIVSGVPTFLSWDAVERCTEPAGIAHPSTSHWADSSKLPAIAKELRRAGAQGAASLF